MIWTDLTNHAETKHPEIFLKKKKKDIPCDSAGMMYKIRKNSCTQRPTQWLPLVSGNWKRDLGEGGGEKVLFLDLGSGSK